MKLQQNCKCVRKGSLRTFFSDKPGARFLNGTKVTLHVMPDYVEYIVKLDHGYYGVVNLMPEGANKVSLLCYWSVS